MLEIEKIFLGPLSLFFSALIWAFASDFYGKLSDRYSPFSVNCFRTLAGLIGSAFIYIFLHGSRVFCPHPSSFFAPLLQPSWLHWLYAVVSVLTSYALGDALFLVSSHSLGLTTAMAITGSVPFLAVILESIIKPKFPSLLQLVGLVLSCGAIIFLILLKKKTFEQKGTAGDLKKFYLGFLMALGASCMFAVTAFSTQRLNQSGLDSMLTQLMLMLLSVPITAIFTFLHGYVFKGYSPSVGAWVRWSDLRPLIWVFFLEGCCGSFLINYGFSCTNLALGSTLLALSPVLATFLWIIQGREQWSLVKMVCFANIIIGVYLLAR